ncbi:Proline-rich receptor-like protein kinase PERK1 [Platanthera guangdongensis]|uniref:non-specific serine/threonine protein kinase n=1 Tax=Platanthera guangdongensis TaxID=2320717 RepID=A0ABR2LX35_9ASPA
MASSSTFVTVQNSSSSSSLPSNNSSSSSTGSTTPPFPPVMAEESSFLVASPPLAFPFPSSNSSSPPTPGNMFSTQSLPSAQDGPPSQSTTSMNSSDTKFNHHVDVLLVIGVAVCVGLFLVAMLFICLWCCKRKKSHNSVQNYSDPSGRKVPQKWNNRQQGREHAVKVQPPNGVMHGQPPTTLMSSTEMDSLFSSQQGPSLPPQSPTLVMGFNHSTFTYEELATATNNFSQSNLLGQGGFGYVHKGLLPNGKEIAVKSLKSGSGQGEREFDAEVDIISRVHHRHLLSIVGYCISGSQRILVYDFVPNKTLEYHLHGKGLPVMSWSTRLKIAIGSAKGIAYLHEDCHPRIIHRDIKSANILLNFEFEALVADFGLAKLSSDNHTHVSTRVMGTFGYLAPEYASSGKLTEKSDVFSYGVMLLELITGRRPVGSSHAFMEDSLVDWARPVLSQALADGNYDEVADHRLDGNYDPVEMARTIVCAAACVRHSAKRRPKMSQIVHALEGDASLEDLNEGMRPGQSVLFSSGSDYESDLYSSNTRRTRKVALASPEYSGDYSGPIAGYGRGPELSASSNEKAFSDELNTVGNWHRFPVF